MEGRKQVHYRFYFSNGYLVSCFRTDKSGDYGDNLLYTKKEEVSTKYTYSTQKAKLQQLKELFDEQLISEDEYESRKKIVLDDLVEENKSIPTKSNDVFAPQKTILQPKVEVHNDAVKDVDKKDYKSLYNGFEGQLKIPFIESGSPQKNFSFGIDFVASYRFNHVIRIGGGIGLQYVDLKYEDAKIIGTESFEAYYESAMSIPIFADFKFDFMKTKCSPFISVDIGYKFYVPFSKYASDNKLGFFISPVLGLDIRFEKCVLCIGLGYEYQCRSFSCEALDVKYGNYSSVIEYIAISF